MRHIFTTFFLTVSFVLLVLGDTYAQLPSDPFVAYSGNPVIRKSLNVWDSDEIFWPNVTFINDTFYIAYIGTDDMGYNTSIGLATSPDGYNFTKSGSNPILQADSTGFDAYSVAQGLLYFSNSSWYLYYSGRASAPNQPGNVISRAVSNSSPHGPWLRSEDTLLTVGSSGEWDSETIGVETILEIDSELVMYYWACDTWPGYPQIGRATSTDGGLNWIKYDDPSTTVHPYRDSDPVLKPEKFYDICGIFGCTVFKLDNSWEMYYSGSISGCTKGEISYATSMDGISWQRDGYNNPQFSPSQDTISQSNVREKPGIVKFDSIYFMYYDYGIIGEDALGIGLATAVNVTSEVLEDNIPSSFSLEQNFPNPFNPDTKIKYSIQHSSRVEIKVFDILGTEIETLVNEEKPVGTYELTWNADNLPSGVYFFTLQARGPSTGSGRVFVETKKMLLLK